MIEGTFNKNYKKFCSDVDSNFGCLPENIENSLQTVIKGIKKIDNFNKYY